MISIINEVIFEQSLKKRRNESYLGEKSTGWREQPGSKLGCFLA